MSRLRVALLAGGKSGERQVSLNGAELVEQYLDKRKYEVIRYDPATEIEKIAHDADEIDVALLVLHGPYGEDGTVQGFLDLLEIPYQGAGVLGSAIAMDKNLTKELYRSHGLPVADWQIVTKPVDNVAEIVTTLSLPLVVKPVKVGSSLGLTIAKTADDVKKGIEKALQYDDQVMIEKFIVGRELTVGVIGNDELIPLPLIEIIPGDKYEFFDYEAKYQPGASEEICPADVDEDIVARAQQFAVQAHQILHLKNYSRTDMILDDQNQLFLLETNTIPGMTINSLLPRAAKVYGLEYPELLDRLIALAME